MEERVLTEEELAQLKLNLERLSVSGVESAYQVAYRDCRLTASHVPPAHAIQQLVCAWKILRKWKRRQTR